VLASLRRRPSRENVDLAGARTGRLERTVEDASTATEALKLVSGDNADLFDAAATQGRSTLPTWSPAGPPE
jgi:hypothetical protein